MSKFKLIFITLVSFILCFAAFTGCNANTGLKSDYLITIDGKGISKDEYLVYLNEAVKNFEEIGGSDIWDTDFDGKSAFDTAKESALSSLKMVKLTIMKAEKNGVSLSDEEIAASEKEAQSYFEQYNGFVSLDVIEQVMQEKALYNKTREKILSEYSVGMSGFDEFFKEFKEEFTEVTYSVIYTQSIETAQEVINKVSQGVDFNTLLEEYKSDNNIYSLTDELSNISDILPDTENIKRGTTSAPVETDKGYAVYYIEDIKLADEADIRQNAEKAYEEIEKNKVFENLLSTWEKETKIEINGDVFNSITKDNIDTE